MARYWSDGYKSTEQVGSPAETTVTMVDRVRWDNKQDPLVFDDHPVLGSESPVTSDGIARAMLQLQDFVKQKDVELCYIDVVTQADEAVLRDKTYIDIRDAYNNGKTLILRFVDSDDKCAYFYDFQGNVFRFVMFEVTDVLNMYTYWISPDDLLHTEQYSAPYKRPNPEVLSITYGDTSVKYDGSKHASINIPKVPAWALGDTKPKYDASEVGAETKGVAASRVNAHNNSDTAHADIRNLIANAVNMFNMYATIAQLNSVAQTVQGCAAAMQTLRQDAVLHSEVIDDVSTNNSRVPLSARQGMLLKDDIAKLESIKPTGTGVAVWNGRSFGCVSYYTTLPKDNQIPRADGGGRLSTNTPAYPLHCANKKYVDDAMLSAVITEKAEGQTPVITDCAAVPPINIKLFGKSTQDGIPSTETPIIPVHHGESGSIVGKVLTSNLFNINKIKTVVTNTIENNGDGTITIKGNSVTDGCLLKEVAPALKVGDVVTLNAKTTATTRKYIYLAGKYNKAWSFGNYLTITEEMLNDEVYWYCDIVDGKQIPCTISEIQLVYGKEVKPYEPYSEQPFTAHTPNGLRGIPLGQTIPDAIKNSPIHMNGVYWDSVEQKYYIGDTKNEDGKDVQRIVSEVLDRTQFDGSVSDLGTVLRIGFTLSNTTISKINALCTQLRCDYSYAGDYEHFYIIANTSIVAFIKKEHLVSADASGVRSFLEENPLTVYYILAEPIVTETDVQYDVVMNYPNTTIVNDAGAYMEVEYVADPKLFITNNYVDKAQHDALAARVLVLEQHVINS